MDELLILIIFWGCALLGIADLWYLSIIFVLVGTIAFGIYVSRKYK